MSGISSKSKSLVPRGVVWWIWSEYKWMVWWCTLFSDATNMCRWDNILSSYKIIKSNEVWAWTLAKQTLVKWTCNTDTGKWTLANLSQANGHWQNRFWQTVPEENAICFKMISKIKSTHDNYDLKNVEMQCHHLWLKILRYFLIDISSPTEFPFVMFYLIHNW